MGLESCAVRGVAGVRFEEGEEGAEKEGSWVDG